MKQLPRNTKLNSLFIFLIVFLSIAYTFPRWADPNQDSRLDMVFAVVEDGTFQIDRFVWNTVDYAKVGSHYYSDKAPGIAFLGIPIYAVVKQLFDLPVMESFTNWLAQSSSFKSTLREEGSGVSLGKVRFALMQIILVVILSALPTSLLAVALFNYLRRFSDSVPSRAVVALSYGLLTPAWVYGDALYGHQLSAFLIFIGFVGITDGWGDASKGRSFLLGLLLGYSILTEYPSVLAVVALGLYAAIRLTSRRGYAMLLFFVLGGILPGIGLMAYNKSVFGGPFDLGYAYSALWQVQHQTGFMSLRGLSIQALWGILFSNFRGLFILSPWLLASVAGFVIWWRRRIARPAFWISLAICGSFLVFNASSVMWWGGFAVGPRYLLPALPFLAVPTIFTLSRFEKATWFRITFALSLLWSLVATWGLALAGQAYPSDTIQNPFIDYALPAWRQGDVARNLGHLMSLTGALSLVPLGILCMLLMAGWLRWLRRGGNKPLDGVRAKDRTLVSDGTA